MKTFFSSIGLLAAGFLACVLAASPIRADHDDHGSRGNGGGGGGSQSGPSGGVQHAQDGPHNSGSPKQGNPQTFSRGPSQHQDADQHQSLQQGNQANQQSQHESFYRGPASDSQTGSDAGNANRQQLNAFLGDKHNNDSKANGDFRSRFTDRDQADRNGENFRRNADSVRHDWRDRNRSDLPFVFGWWNDDRFSRWPLYSPWRYSYYRGRPWFWWQWADAPGLTSWLPFNWGQPYYWDYGPNGYIYYNNNQVYQNGQPYMAADQYYQQLYSLAHSAPQISPDDAAKIEWKPPGAFAITQEGKADGNRMMQLAISKQGVLSGTYYNQQTNATHPLQGMVDQKSQRAAWAFADGTDDQTVMETSIYNLTEPQSTMMTHFGPGQASISQLVRLEQPDSPQSQNAPNNAAAAPQGTLP
jgi:hypothetical protein